MEWNGKVGYPISEDLLRESLDFAKTHAKIEEEEVKLIMNWRKSVLFNSGNVWMKKDRDFDVTMWAQDGGTRSLDGSHKPYKKPNSTIKYVNKGSNHPPSITKNIPSSIQKRLNSISSCEKEFIDAKGEYQKALTDAGYTHELT